MCENLNVSNNTIGQRTPLAVHEQPRDYSYTIEWKVQTMICMNLSIDRWAGHASVAAGGKKEEEKLLPQLHSLSTIDQPREK